MSEITQKLERQYKGKKVLVVGLGLLGGGVGIAKFFAGLGAKVVVTDKKDENSLKASIIALRDLPIIYHLGGHDLKDFLEADIIFKGPSVPWTVEEIMQADKKGIPIEMELSFFAKHSPAKLIGVTGTRGKSTVTQMIFNLLKSSGYSVYLGGGLPQTSTINFLKTLTKNDWIVLEISSWALSGFHCSKISPHIAVFTNIYPDHLNYYENMEDYLYDKKAIFMYQKNNDYLIINSSLLNLLSDSFCASSKIIFSRKDFPYTLKHLKGVHNLENAAAALQVAKVLKINENKAVKIISGFQGLAYRQQIVGKKNKTFFVNDTTSTTPIATIKAIETFKDKKIILVMGGNSKNLPIDDLIKNLDKVERIVLLSGSFTDQIIDKLKSLMPEKIIDAVYDNLEKAIIKAYKLAQEIPHDEVCILFSPAATSFSMFNNEFHRGEEFNRIVKKLIYA